VPRFGARRVLGVGVVVTIVAGVALMLVSVVAPHAWWALLPPLFCFVATVGSVGPNGFAVALEASGRSGGAGSALAGCVQFALAAGAGAFVSLFDNRHSMPMAATMAAFAIVTALAAWWTPRAAPR
jgi:DHA1 family bicyclomycin/chloramphenicol resistance-like MFS transporter